MRIRTQLIAGVSTALAVGVLATAVVLAAAGEERLADSAQTAAQETSHEAAGLLALTQEFARYGGERAAQQWHERHRRIAEAVRAHTRPSSQQSVALPELQAVAESLPALFVRLQSLPPARDEFSVRRREALLEQLITNTQAMNDYAYQWYQEASAVRRGTERRFQLAALITPLVMLCMLVVTSWLVHRRLLKPMGRIAKAADQIGGGDLTHRIASNAQDELGDLSRQLDEMTNALVRSRQEAQQAAHQLRTITDNLPVLITYVDQEERLRFINKTVRRWLGRDPSDIIGQPVPDVVSPQDYALRKDRISRALGGERVSFELETRVSGEVRHLQNIYIPDVAPDGSVAGIYTLSTDVSALKRVELRLSQMLRSDPLTGLANRFQLNEALPQALARASRHQSDLALLYLDIDRFKQINDSLGHAGGDAVLQQFAQRLQSAVRATDTAIRLAGDEFVVLLEDLKAESEAHLVAQKILKEMAPLFQLPDRQLAVTTSIGVAYCRANDLPMSPEHLLDRADRSLYAAKQAGRNTYRVEVPAA